MAERNDKVVGKIQIKHVKKKFTNPDGSEVIALNDVNLDVEPGSFVSLIGPSGCGKTTLFQWLNIRQNIAFGLKARSVYKKNKEEVDKFIKLVGLEGFEKSYPHQLSGGMCQRASLARALVGHPKVLLLDEPLGALDAFTRMKMQDEILNIWKEHKMTMMMVTHDVDEAVYIQEPCRKRQHTSRHYHMRLHRYRLTKNI